MVDTDDIIKIALGLAGWRKLPADSHVHLKGTNIRKVLIAIDVTTAELMLAKSLGCQAVITHHPIGVSSLNFHKVFDRHVDYMTEHQISKSCAKRAIKKLKERVEVNSHGKIYNEVIDAAKLLKIALVNIHQPCDEYMRKKILEKINCGKSKYVSDIIKSVEEIPEFRNSATRVQVRYGNKKNKTGTWALVIAAGTNGGFPVAKEFYEHGVSTVIYLHIDYRDLTKMYEEKLKGNLIVLGHAAGDSIGLNALAKELNINEVDTVKMGIISGDKIR